MEISVHAAKKALRQELKQRLKNMSPENRYKQSQIIIAKLLQNQKYANSKRISVYLSRDIEVGTESILLDIFNSGKHCFIPTYDSKSTCMNMVRLNSIEEYRKLPLTTWNIKQPDHTGNVEDVLSSGGLDLMIVPGIGFTKDGQRIGNGKGYYDIYLNKYTEIIGKTVYTMALAFEEQMVPFIPTDEKDVRIDEVITSD